MRHQAYRRWSFLTLLVFVLGLIPQSAPAAGQTLDDAAARFARQRAFIAGRRTLPVPLAGVVAAPPALAPVDQAARLARLVERWKQAQTRELAPPSGAAGSTLYLAALLRGETADKPQDTPPALQEVPGYRTATSTVYAHPDGRWETRVYGQPINYQASDGQWTPFAPRLQSQAHRSATGLGGYRVAGTDLDLWFARPTAARALAATNGLVELRDQELELRFTPQGADARRSRAEGASITYQEAFPGADLRYSATGPGVKEELIFARPPAADFALTFDIAVSGGSLEQQGQTVLVRRSDGSPAYGMSAPFMIDAQGRHTTEVTVTLRPTVDGRATLVYAPSAAWLADPQRTYPVILDPTLAPVYPAGDTYVANNIQNAPIYHFYEAQLFLGNSTITAPNERNVSRFFMNFQLPPLPADVSPGDIDSATLSIYQFIDERGGAYDTRIYATQDPWKEEDYNWYNHDSIQGDFHSLQTVSAGHGRKSFGLTSLVQGWYGTTISHPRGVLFAAADETRPGGLFASSSCTHGNYCDPYDEELDPRPYLSISYTPAPPPPPGYEEVRTVENLTFTPDPAPAPNTSVTARFKLKNVGSRTVLIPTLQVRMSAPGGGNADFPAASAITLNPGDEYVYSQSRSLADAGFYYGQAMFSTGSAWYRVYIAPGSTVINARQYQVKSTLPPLDDRTQGPDAGNGSSGDPVNTSTGNFVSSWIDATLIDASQSLVLGRTFNSLDVDQAGMFGAGWTGVYDERLIRRPDESVIYVRGNGQRALFTANLRPEYQEVVDPETGQTSGEYRYVPDGSYAVEDGFDLSVTRNLDTGAWTITERDQTGRVFDADGRLQSITDRYGAAIRLNYAAGRLSSVASAVQRCDFAWAGDRVQSIACPTGALTYGYNASGDLVSVTNLAGETTTYAYDAGHRIASITDANGRLIVENIYDSLGRVAQQREGITGWTSFTYATGARTTTYTDANGQPLTDTYDARDRLVSRVDALGNADAYTYDADDHLLSRTNALNHTWHYTYDAQGNLLTERDPLGGVWTYAYNGRNQRISQTDPLGHVTTFVYAGDTLQSSVNASGGQRSYQTTSAGLITSETDELGRTTTRTYSPAGLMLSETDPSGAVTRFEYNAAGDQTAMIDALGQRAEYEYDAQHRQTRIRYPDGSSTRMFYDAMGNMVREINRAGNERQRFFDGNNRLIGETDFSGAVTEYFYDGVGNLERVVDALDQETTFAYDAVNRLASRTNRLGHTWTYGYDAVGRMVAETDPLGRQIRHEYDALGRETRTIDARGNAVSRTYDLLGRVLTETSARGGVTTFAYDALGRLTSRTDALGNATRFEYDAVGNQLRIIDPLGNVASTDYDATNRPTRQVDRVGAQTRSQFDKVGRLIARTDPRGAVTRTTFDAMDRPVATTDGLGFSTAMAYDAEGRLVRSTDARGFAQSWTYDPQGRQLTATDRTGAVSATEYDALGRAVRKIDALGNVTAVVYDAEGQVIAETDPRGNTTLTTYDAVGNPIRRTDPRGNATVTEYDANNNAIRVIDALGHATVTEYDANNNPVRVIDALGHATVTEYDLLDRIIAVRDPFGATTATEYDALGRVARTTDPRGAVTALTYDAEGRTLTSTDGLGNVTRTTYDSAGAPLTQTDPRGGVTRTTYDLLGRVIRTNDALDQITQMVYDPAGNVIKTIDPRGAVTATEYDGAGRAIARTDALGKVWRTEYDALGRVVRAIDPLGNAESTIYDAAGNVVRTVKPGGQFTSSVYDAANNRVATTDARGLVTLFAYDALNRLVATTSPEGDVTRTDYDALGRTSATHDANGHALSIDYDVAGRTTTVTDALSQTVTTRYDIAGAPAITLDGNGHRSRVEYDLLGRPTAQIDALGNRTRTSYDPAGNAVAERRANNQSVSTSYDRLNRPLAVTLTAGVSETLRYDPAGNVTVRTGADGSQTTEYDLLGRPVRGIDSGGQKVEWRYDAAGRRTHVIYPDGRSVVTGYDSNGWPVRIDDGRGHVITIRYDADGRPLDIVYPNSSSHAAYDGDGELVGIQNSGAAGPFAIYYYELDAVGNRTLERIATRSFGAPVTIEETAYSYDAVDRLVRSVRQGPAATPLDLRYAYDKAGNRLAVTAIENGATWTQQMRYDAADRLIEQIDSRSGTTTFAYDSAGQRISASGPAGQQRFQYDSRGRLLRLAGLNAGGTVTTTLSTYVYDGLNRRTLVEQHNAAGGLLGSERTLYDGEGWNVLGQSGAGAPPQWFVLHPQGMGHLAVETAGQVRFAHTDGLGSYAAYTDAAGNPLAILPARYGDWGAVESGAAGLASSYGYTGHRQDSGGLIYGRNRFYDPASATWLTSDPYPADRMQPGGLNRYAYVRGNPISRTDPLGLFDWNTGTVEYGDTLSQIALDAGVTLEQLLALNPSITNANRIDVGQHVNVSASSAASSAHSNYQAAQTAGTNGARCGLNCGETYTVRYGDTLSGIGARAGIPYQWIANANGISNPNLIYPGQRLYIPCNNSGSGSGNPGNGSGNPGNGGGGGKVYPCDFVGPIGPNDRRDCPVPVGKTVTVNITHLNGSSADLTRDIQYANDKVYEQANVKVHIGKTQTINESDSKGILGDDLVLHEFTNPSQPTDEEKKLLKINRTSNTITMYYVKRLSDNSTGEAFDPSSGSPVAFIVSNSGNRATFSHELGHVLTLDHVPSDNTNLMYNYSNPDKYKLTTEQINAVKLSPYVK